jgi:hypothetical protein
MKKHLPRARWFAVAALFATLTACGYGEAEDTSAAPAPSPAPAPAPALGAFATFQSPALWIGQPDATSELFGASASTFTNVRGTAVGDDGKLYIGDLTNRRVLAFDALPTTSGASANFVVGAADFTSMGSLTGANGIHAHGGKLAVVLTFDHQVALYATAPQAFGAAPGVLLGQKGTAGCTADRFELPNQPFYSPDGKFLVTDGENHRVLIWNTVPTAAGQLPDLVLGQASFTHCVANDDNQDGTVDLDPTARTLSSPAGIWTDGKRLAVVDSSNNRVLIWNTFPTQSFQPADQVLGQTSLNAALDQVGPSGFILPHGIAWNGRYLAVSDSLNNRVLLWDGFPASNGVPASIVLGQPDFEVNTERARDATTLTFPTHLSFRGDTLLVTESGNRISVFKAAP